MEGFQGIVQCDEILSVRHCHVGHVRQRHLKRVTATLGPTASASGVDENAPHDPGRHTEKMRSVLPLYVVPVHESHVHLVDQRGRLEDVTASLACHLPRSHAVQFLLHERRKGVQGALVSMTPGDQQASDVRRRTRLHPRVLSRMLAL